MNTNELHLFIIWSNASKEFRKIMDDIRSNFEIIKIFEVEWEEERFVTNLVRFYAHSQSHLCEEEIRDVMEAKKEHCGGERFLVVAVLDANPVYEKKETSSGTAYVNKKMFESKERYRELTGGGHKVHATNSVEEADKDLIMLFGFDSKKFLEKYGKEKSQKIELVKRDITGTKGWESLEQLFGAWNTCLNYVVLRNFEKITGKFGREHKDIDVLTDNLNLVVNLSGYYRIFDSKKRAHYVVEIGGEAVYFDFRQVGDNYFDKKWQKDVLNNRVLENGLYIPKKEDYFYTLLYHALIHKPKISDEYLTKLSNLAEYIKTGVVAADLNSSESCADTLFSYMEKHKYDILRPNDPSVFYNEKYKEAMDAEKKLFGVFKSKDSKKKAGDILRDDPSFTLINNLSPERENLLSWYPFKKTESLLEIGSGMGALTGLFCEKLGKVTAMEPIKRKSELTSLRHKERDNLTVVAGGINNIKPEEKFDYITSIGVLEYAGKYIKTVNPYLDFLIKLKSFLNKNGTLIIAIENKFGLKYWAGAKEDHTGRNFDSLEGYPFNKNVATFGKKEIERLLKEAGFKEVIFYYPLPDYKFPTEIFSDGYTPSAAHNIRAGLLPAIDLSQERVHLFNEKLVSDNIILNDNFDFFANSFLIFAS